MEENLKKINEDKINEIIDIIYDKYVDENQVFDIKTFKAEQIDLYNIIIDEFKKINNFFIYSALAKKNNNAITRLNDLKNYLALCYIEQNRMNGMLYTDIIAGTDFSTMDVSNLYIILKNIYNINDIVE